MPVHRRVAQFNRAVANRIAGPLFRRLPGFGTIHHRGRRSGRPYATPVKIFRRGDDYVITLPYGPGSDWVRNVLADGGCVLETRSTRVPLTKPTLVADDGTTAVPRLARWFMARLDSTTFLVLSRERTQR